MENQNQNPKDQLVERLKTSNNILVTVSNNPSVDQLSAAIGLTIMLNQLDKHATAVFSGEVPNTLEFLKPEETLEKNTDSLRDFIISLDKAKADKLRYKVEDTFVKIFITPYKTSLSESDLVFGQGDFNVDVVIALGVHQKEDLDQAITNHGRILHDAVVITVNTSTDGQIGSINWVDSGSSSLSEMLVPVCDALKPNALDTQIATAFLTGIVSETNRFSNEKTTSDTMNISAKLMSAGANQQLVATKLEEAVAVPLENTPEVPEANVNQGDGSLEIEHIDEPNEPQEEIHLPEIQSDNQEEFSEPDQNIDAPMDNQLDYEKPEEPEETQESKEPEEPQEPSRLILDPPRLGGKLTANTEPEPLDPSIDPLGVRTDNQPILSRNKKDKSPEPVDEPSDEGQPTEPLQSDASETPHLEPQAPVFPTPPLVAPDEPDGPVIPELAPAPTAEEPQAEAELETDHEPEAEPADEQPVEEPIIDTQTLSDLEEAVDSPHVESEISAEPETTPDADAALAAAHQALEAASAAEVPPNSDGQMEVSHDDKPAGSVQEVAPPELEIDPATGEIRYPTNLVSPSNELPPDPTAASVTDPTAPPAVPPPMPMPPIMPPMEPPVDTTDPNNLPPVNQ